MKREKLLRYIGAYFTLLGIFLVIIGNTTDGFLSMILGELVALNNN